MFDTLVISGGGIKGFSSLGALYFFYKNGLLNEIQTYCGCSIGSVLCLLLNCGYSPVETFTHLANVDLMRLVRTENLTKVVEKFGLIDINDFAGQIEILVRKKFDAIPTLRELYDNTHKRLIVTVTNATHRRAEYLDYENSPTISCIDAIKMSCNLPLVFQRIVYNECVYTDGGLLDNFPILRVDTGWNNVLGINTSVNTKEPNLVSLQSYLYELLFLPISEIQRLKLSAISSRCYTVAIPIEDSPGLLDFAVNEDIKKTMFESGYMFAKKRWKNEPYIEENWA